MKLKKKGPFQKKCQAIHIGVFQNYVIFFYFIAFDVVFHMFNCINQTLNRYNKYSLDKNGEGNVVLDLAISSRKFPKIVKQEEKNPAYGRHRIS